MRNFQSAKPDEFFLRVLRELTDEILWLFTVILENLERVKELSGNCLWTTMVFIFKINGAEKFLKRNEQSNKIFLST